ncbi:MAG TPA: hypothetical protein RMH99_08370 [Sandaracinaceae bacterium LLY-WYZ-13_1]|nr:hypothetical protein [Sandaracinaceae bacterium LLY-WYZ-13_1]
MGTAWLFGLAASSALVLGALAGLHWRPPKRVTGVLLAFASGTLIAALAFELFPEAVHLTGLWRSTLGLTLGGGVFVAFNTWLDRRAAPAAVEGEKDEQRDVVREATQRGMGLALLASVTLDGIPENLALGVSLETDASITLLVAIFASNLPESLVGSIAMRKSGKGRRWVLGLWAGAAALLTVVVVLGRGLGGIPAGWLGFAMAFAGGAVLASLADTLMPEAFERGRPLNSFATAAGFVLSFALSGVVPEG